MIRALQWAAEFFLVAAFLAEVVWPALRRKPLFPTYRKLSKPRKENK